MGYSFFPLVWKRVRVGIEEEKNMQLNITLKRRETRNDERERNWLKHRRRIKQQGGMRNYQNK